MNQTTGRPDVTILIPVYNTARFLPRALDSVLAQTWKNLEVVAVNDASPDNAAEVLADYAARDPRVRIVTCPENGGTLKARLSGLATARGRYLMNLDADDTFDPDCVKTLVEIADRENADVVGFGCRQREENCPLRNARTLEVEKRCLEGPEVFEAMFFRHRYSWSLCFKLIRRELFERAAQEIPPVYAICAEDFYFYTAVSFFAKKFIGTGKIFYNYYTGIGITDVRLMDRAGFTRFGSIFTSLNGVKEFLKRQGAFERCREGFEAREREHFNLIFERWPGRILPEQRSECFRLMTGWYDPAAVVRHLEFCFGTHPETVAAALGRDAFPPPGKQTVRAALEDPRLFWKLLEAKVAGKRFEISAERTFDHLYMGAGIPLHPALARLADCIFTDTPEADLYWRGHGAQTEFQPARPLSWSLPGQPPDTPVEIFVQLNNRENPETVAAAFALFLEHCPQARLMVAARRELRPFILRALQLREIDEAFSFIDAEQPQDPEKPVYRIVWIFQPYLAQAEMPAAWRDFPAVGYEQLQNPAFQPGCGCFPVPSGDPGRLVITTARLLKGETVPAIEDRRTTEQRLTAILAHISAAHGFERPLPHGREQLRLEAAILKRRARNLFFQIARRLLPSESLRWQCANRIRTIFKPRV
ncbi:glycosyltransferase family 2 protein [Victivallis vadensis]|uniref:Glycosyltransferase involved in cell wall biosynthesis n=1 Tax=Victivallis vadensis TaxID=172901 RepID=A0A2U1AQY7_9BACT|nr:glycosyltransferase family 2 protein [Victivallis vadensis]PVY38832.1 glycosyltransferase involved in cell wall biosynthesis [Victivallis vadensis]